MDDNEHDDAAQSAILSVDVLQHAFTAMGVHATSKAANVCKTWQTAALAVSSWSTGLLAQATAEKNAGNELFRRGDAASAHSRYTHGLKLLAELRSWNAGTSSEEAAQLELACHANRAACSLQRQDVAAAADDAFAATFDAHLQPARRAQPMIATKAALRLMEAAERATASGLQLGSASERFGSPQAAARAAVMEARYLLRPSNVAQTMDGLLFPT
jgi:hypothetical protein